jgi:NDP-sugar pyrophosphorylase family protein
VDRLTLTPPIPRAMILAAGLGTRLEEVGRHLPKPLLPVCGVPLVGWVARWLAYQGVREIVVNLHHLGDQIRAELGDGRELGVSIAYSEEAMILGTGGGLRQARALLDDGKGTPIVVVNGKILLELELDRLLAFHRAKASEATMVLRRDREGVWGGSLELDRTDRVVRILDVDVPGAGAEGRVGSLMFTGVHVFEPRFLDRIPAEGPQCVIRTAYAGATRAGTVHGSITGAYWWEHSTVPRYLEGVANVLDGRVDLPFAPGPLRGVAPGARVEPGAQLSPPVFVGSGAVVEAGARVGPHVQVGAGARIRGGVSLRRCVVLDGALVAESAEDRVLLPDAPHAPAPGA